MIPKLSQLIYGGDFHPEAWPEALWTEDVALMRRAGVNLVTIGASCWARLQSGPDTYTFEWLDRVFDRLHENGILVSLSTGTGAPPPWFTRVHPEDLAASSGERTLHHLNSPVYREQAGRLVRQLATRYGPNPALALWHVNPAAIAQASACHCERCATLFRIWLQQRYKTLDVLNEHWGTGHTGQFYYQWEEALPPVRGTDSNPAQQLDYRRFVSDSLLTVLLDEKSILRELTPDIPVTTSFAGDAGLESAANGFDWAQHVDFISFNSNPDPADTEAGDIAFAYDVQRGLGGGRPWLLRQLDAPGETRRQNPVRRPDQMRLWSYQALAHGADGVMFARWRAASAGPEKFGSAILPHGFTETRSFREAERLGGELKKLSSIRGAKTRAEVALIVDWENMGAVELNSQLNYAQILRNYYRALFEPDVPIDILPPDVDLTNYKVALAPALHLVRPGVAENFQSFVDKGGTFLTTFFSGMVDASNRVLPGGHPAAFRSLLGLQVEESDAFGEQVRHIKTALRGARCTLWADIIHLEGAEAIATFTEEFYAHGPAITRNAVGRGLAYYVGTQPEPGFLRSFLAEICADCGVRPPMRVPAGVEVATRFNEHGEFLFLLNHNATMQFVDIGPRIRRDLLTGEMIKGQCQLGPRDARVLQLA